MSDPKITVAMIYGPGMAFSLEIMPDGSYAFALGGNTPPLFPRTEMGRWMGQDPKTASALRTIIPQALSATSNNASTRPDSAYTSARVLTKPPLSRSFALYDPPAAWAPVQRRILDTVHGPWIDARERTVAGGAGWASARIDTRDRPVANVTLTHTGREPLRIESPTDRDMWIATILPETITPEQAETYPRELRHDELQLSGPSAPGAVDLAPGAVLQVTARINRALAPGRYIVRLDHATTLRADGFRLDGMFSFSLSPLEVTP